MFNPEQKRFSISEKTPTYVEPSIIPTSQPSIEPSAPISSISIKMPSSQQSVSKNTAITYPFIPQKTKSEIFKQPIIRMKKTKPKMTYSQRGYI